jgi:hypothetical protein
LNPTDLISRIQSFIFVLRRGQTEQILAAAVVALFGLAAYISKEVSEFPQSARIVLGLLAVGAILAIVLFLRIWRQAVPPPPPPDTPVSNAIKGLLPFTVADGSLFARLGRSMELQYLLGVARNDQLGTAVVRGQSGSGKTSLLRAGLAYTLGKDQCIYWEAVPTRAPEALLFAIRNRLPSINSLESLPEACSGRYILILDQFEQLQPSEPEHAPVFNLLERIAKAPAPHSLSAVVSFRREFAADWLDFEQSHCFRAEQLPPVNLLAPQTASDALVTLATEAGFTLDNALVKNFIASIQRPEGISPVDVGIGILGLANFVQQRGNTHVGLSEYKVAGGAEGLLLSFVQQKLEEIPEQTRGPLLKGIVLALVDFSNNQRVSGGASSATIASKAEMPANSLVPLLERLTHPRIRLLEKTEVDLYRLPHERLVPILRRLTGRSLASLDQLRLTFESEFAQWRATRSGRHLLRGRYLNEALINKDQLVQGEAAIAKNEYLSACSRRRQLLRLATSACFAVLAVASYEGYREWDASIQRQKLITQGLPPILFKAQYGADSMELEARTMNDLTWLRSSKVREIHISMDTNPLQGLDHLSRLKTVSVNLRRSALPKLFELALPDHLSSLSLHIDFPKNLTPVDGEQTGFFGNMFFGTAISQFADIERPRGVSNLALEMSGTALDLAALNGIKGVNSLSLDLRTSSVENLDGIEEIQGIPSLSLDLRGSKVHSLKPLGKLGKMESLSLVVDKDHLKNLEELRSIGPFDNILLDLLECDWRDLQPQLANVSSLTPALTLKINGAQVPKFGDLAKVKGLTELVVDAKYFDIPSLAQLKELKDLRSISLDLVGSGVESFQGLEQVEGLAALTLRMAHPYPLTQLGQLKKLKSLTLTISAEFLSELRIPSGLAPITNLRIEMYSSMWDKYHSLDIPSGCKSVTLIFQQGSGL